MIGWGALTGCAREPAILAQSGCLRFDELRDAALRRAASWAREGMPATHLLHGHNHPGLIVDLLACHAAGRVPVLVNPRIPAERAAAWHAEVSARCARQLAPGEAIADIVFTSGTTGVPKAVVHTQGNHAASAEGANAHLPFGPGDRWLLSLSLAHVGGLGVLARALVGGGAVALPERGEPLAAALARTGSTHLSVVPSQLRDLLADAEGRGALVGLRCVLVGGGPCPEGWLRAATELGVPLAQTWGLTETTAQVATSARFAPDTCGQALRHREVKLTPEGRLAVRGPVLARGYLGEDACALPLDEEGYFVTQDRGTLDGLGRVRVTGRADLVFISGGENLQPEEIEHALLALPGIREAVVVPLPHPRWGQRPVAIIDSVDDAAPEAWRKALEPHLARFQMPDAFLPWPEDMPRMKPSRERLTAYARARLGVPASSSETPADPSER